MARYMPGNVPTDTAAIAVFLRDELEKIAQAIETPNAFLALDTLYAQPLKFREGTIIKADGVTYNPGSGAGVYCRRGAVWTFLG